MTEALREAKAQVLHQLKCQGFKASHFTAKEIAERADALIAANREAALARAVERLLQWYGKA
jgi:hypothetical protein